MWVGLRAAVAAVVFAGAAIAAPAPRLVLLGLDVLLGLLVAADVVLAPAPARVGFERSLPPVLRTRTPTTIAYTVRNPVGWHARVWVREAAVPSFALAPDVHAVALPAHGSVATLSTATPGRRGIVPLGPVTIRTAGPLGLAGRQRTLPYVQTVKVYPELPGRAQAQTRLERARLLGGQRTSAVRGGGTDFDTLREYSVDDEFRRINWHATARTGRAITNVYREERNQAVVITLDASRAMAQTVDGAPRLEHGLDAAMALARVASRAGDHVGAIAFAAGVLAFEAPRGGRGQPRRLLDLLFAIEPALDAADYAHAFGTLLARHRRRSLLVLLTEPAEEGAMESLFRALPMLTRPHLVLVGAVLDPALERAASMMPASSEEAYLKGAAAAALAWRQRTIERLRALGADVVDRLPADLPGALCDRYLRIKAYGRL